MNLVSKSEFVTMTSVHHLVYIFVIFSTLSIYVHPLKVFLCLFCCSVFLTLLEVIKLTFNVYFTIRINLRIYQILCHYYLYVGINISDILV